MVTEIIFSENRSYLEKHDLRKNYLALASLSTIYFYKYLDCKGLKIKNTINFLLKLQNHLLEI